MLKYILFLLFLACVAPVDAEIRRRAAFDFGSGKIKVQVADIDTDNHKILQSIYTEDIVVLLSEDAAHHPEGLFSEEIQRQAIAAASILKQKAHHLGAVEFSGLATEAYRIAPNGNQLVDRYLVELNLPVKIISQFDEGKNGFLALVAENNLDPAQVISWDIGSGSFQVTYLDEEKNIHVYMAPFGRSTTKNALIKNVKGEDPLNVSSPNPMSRTEWESALQYLEAVLPSAPNDLILKLKETDVQLIGISAHPEKLRLLKTYRLDDLFELLEERLNKSDNDLTHTHRSPATAVSELALVCSIMHKLNVDTVHYKRTTSGSTSALLLEEEHWHGVKKTIQNSDS